jgi:hypothetical protein
MKWFQSILLKFSWNSTFYPKDDYNIDECGAYGALGISILTIFGWRQYASSSSCHPNLSQCQTGSIKQVAFCPICRVTVNLPRIVSQAFMTQSVAANSFINPASSEITSPSENRVEANDQLTIVTRKRSRSYDHYAKCKGSKKSSPPKRLKVAQESSDHLLDDESWLNSLSKISRFLSSKLEWSEKFNLIETHRYFCPYASGFVSEKIFPEQTVSAWEAILSSLFLFYREDGEREGQPKKSQAMAQNILRTLRESFSPLIHE